MRFGKSCLRRHALGDLLLECVREERKMEGVGEMDKVDLGPIRLCCGQRHWTVACPDGLVLCGLCLHRKPIEEMNVLPTGQRENACKLCAEDERRRAEEKTNP